MHSLWLLVLLKLLVPSPVLMRLPWPVETAAPTAASTDISALRDSALASRVVFVPVAGTEIPDALPKADEDPGDMMPPVSQSPLDSMAETSPAIASRGISWSWKLVLASLWLAGACAWWFLAAVRIQRFRRLLHLAQAAPAEVNDRCRQLAVRIGLAEAPGVWLVPGPVSPMLW